VRGLLDNFLAVAIIGGIAFAFWRMWRSMTRPDRTNPDACPKCGYDMQETPRRCPECGWVAPTLEDVPELAMERRLLDTAPPDAIEPRRPEPGETRVTVFETDSGRLADVVAEHLDARGILAEVVTKESSMQRGAWLGRDLYNEVRVWSGDKDLAEAIIKAASPAPEKAEDGA
jgi:hypothetical protein